ncbi:peptidylprolyl isomerase [Paenibacillus sp. Soil766]|uniref:peptidylprolyl isomerase n=1 Tax=Paenibacillus sp. Soil766 TaxID=1736404 RepID=UPI000A46B9E5|nr:peptidylprolyl isomerase [Paenibacillus sp. Soil766]
MMKFKKIVVALLIVIPIAVSVMYYASAGANSSRAPVAKVNGSVITSQEFESELEEQRATVIDYFYRLNGAEYGKNFWKTDVNGDNPEDTAKMWALKEIIRFKIELELAQQHGLIQGTSYDDLLQEMDKENKRRIAAVNARETIYGPVQLDESTFMNYYLSKLRTQLKEKLSEVELRVTEAELKQHYELVKDTLFTKEDRIRFQKIAVSYKENVQSSTNNPKKPLTKKLMDSIKISLDKGKEMDETVRELQGQNEAIAVRYTEEEFNSDTASTYFKSQAVLYSVLTDSLEANQVSSVLDETMQSEYVLVKVVERETGGYKSFDENERNVWKNYVDTTYGAYLDKLIREAKVEINESNYKSMPIH